MDTELSGAWCGAAQFPGSSGSRELMHRADVFTRAHQPLGRAGLRLWLLQTAL